MGADIFLKLHTHGAQESNVKALLNGELDNTFRLLRAECRRRRIELRYATPWEMRLAVERAARWSGDETHTAGDVRPDAAARSCWPFQK